MTPFEILLLIVITIVVVIMVCFCFGMFKGQQTLEQTPESGPESDNDPVIVEVKEESEAPVKHYAPAIPPKTTAKGKNYTYTILNKWYLAKDGDYYQTIQSTQGSIFYITREGKRRYLSAKEKEQLKEFM